MSTPERTRTRTRTRTRVRASADGPAPSTPPRVAAGGGAAGAQAGDVPSGSGGRSERIQRLRELRQLRESREAPAVVTALSSGVVAVGGFPDGPGEHGTALEATDPAAALLPRPAAPAGQLSAASSRRRTPSQPTDKTRVQVCVRVRPLIESMDGRPGQNPLLHIDEERNTLQVPALNGREPKAYRLDAVFGTKRPTSYIYDQVFSDSISRMLQGYNATIFAYGQTGSGKTHTMAGDAQSPGIAQLAFAQIFDQIKRSPEMRYNMSLSIMEIYQDTIYDLFARRAKVEMQSGGACGLRFNGLTEHPVRNEEEVGHLVARGMEGKTMGANYRHEHSSRSHTVVRLLVESRHETDDKLTGVVSGSLMLVDLAGSETVHENTDAKATSEGKAIVKSLFHLRQCVHALANGKRPDFRSSKLTRLLEPSMINGCVSLICNCACAVSNARQIVDALEFGRQAQHVALTPTQNTVGGDSEFHKLKAMMDAELAAAQQAQYAVQDQLAEAHADYGRQIAELQSRVVSATTLETQVEQLTVEKEAAEMRTAAAMAEKEGLQAQLRAMMEDTRHTLAELDAKERSVAEREAAFALLQQQYDATRTVQEQLKASVNVAERAMKERMEEAATKEAALLEMRAENEKLDIEREAAQRLLSEMEDAGAQKAAELAALARENESLSQERTEMERLVSTAQQQAEATSLELSHTIEENLNLRESAESMQVELHRLKAEKLAQQAEIQRQAEDRSGMEQQVARHSEEKRELLSTVKEDAVTKSSVQQIIYDIERESQAQIGRLLEENGRKEAQIVRLRAELEEAQRLRVDVDELRQYCRQLEAESGRWKCRSCTFINQARNASCEMCNVPNSATTDGEVGGSGDYEAAGTGQGARSYSQQSPRSGRSAHEHGIVGLPPS